MILDSGIKPSPWLQSGYGLDPAWDWAREDLVFAAAVLDASSYDHISGSLSSSTNNETIGVNTSLGYDLQKASAAAWHYGWSHNADMVGKQSQTWEVFFHAVDFSRFGGAEFSNLLTKGDDGGWPIRIGLDANVLKVANPAKILTALGTAQISNGDLVHHFTIFETGGGDRWFLRTYNITKGIIVTVNSDYTAGDPDTDTAEIRIGTPTNTVDGAPDAEIILARWWNGTALTEAQVNDLWADPFGMFRRRDEVEVVIVPAAAAPIALIAIGIPGIQLKTRISFENVAIGVETLVSIPTFKQVLTATATGIATLARKVKLGLANIAVGIVDIVVNAILGVTELALAATAIAVSVIRLKTKKTLTSTAAGIAALVDIPTFFIAISTAATGIATLTKKAKLGLSDTAVGIVSLARKARLSLNISATGVVGLARKVKIALRNIASGIAAIIVTFQGLTLLALAATATAIAALQITVKKTLEAVSLGVATLDPIAAFRLLLTAVGTAVVTLTKIPTFRLAFPAIATGLAALGKKPKLGLAATASGIVSINRTIFKTLQRSAQGIATLVLIVAELVTIAATAIGIPALTLKTKRGLSAVGSGVARIQRTMRKTLGAIATGIATLNEEGPSFVVKLKTFIIGFFGGPGGGPGR